MGVGNRALDPGELLVVAPALVGIGLAPAASSAARSGCVRWRTAKRVSVATKSAIGIDGAASRA